MVLTTEKLIQGGAALATTRDGKKVFIPDALPGETVEVSLVASKAGYCTATIDRILEPSTDRIVPPCHYYSICGGCDFQYAAPPVQAQLKQTIVEDNLRRIGGVDVDSVRWEPPAQDRSWRYRTRARFHVDIQSKSVGFLARKSNSLVALDDCPILSERLNTLLSEPQRLFQVARKTMLHGKKGSRKDYAQVSAFCGDDGISLEGEDVALTLDGHRFMVTNDVFFQSNPFVLPVMAKYVASKAEGAFVMDLYSGVGTFSAFLAQPGRKVIAVERDPKCLRLAKQNVPDCEFYTSAVENWAKGPTYPIDTVVVDPPRVGLEVSVPSLIASFKPKRIIYVSCNSVTLARDLQRLRKEGYTLVEARMFDLYVQTFHHEVVAILEKKETFS